jgi:hypothetical protein
MNKKQKTVLYSALSIILASFIMWIAYGREVFTKTQVLIEKKDELFPDMVQKEWIDKFIWGLDLSSVIIGFTLLATVILIYLFRTKKSN